MATVVTDENFEAEVLKSDIPVMVDFYADWCGPCKALTPVIDELSGEFDGKVKIVKVNVDESQQTAQKFGVMSIPTLIMFKGGEEAERLTGALPKDTLSEKLNGLLG
ncbi:thioredoxin [Candidatus Peregrinibacteria bacterium]|jgi:thioredoxin 1|nr:thioredoxin [Candidatus Peregrinibacteria bacterium]MBT4631427.1 thioredoxin [Candidatus Peregrinibacteria bacterium]MBT5516936.1 thioredoxin [Candidatus Peregrinibacteria bacterium]MBT5823988.1 thioredoxin [Candidatus Peregrinibacteria bacterium]